MRTYRAIAAIASIAALVAALGFGLVYIASDAAFGAITAIGEVVTSRSATGALILGGATVGAAWVYGRRRR